MIKNLTYNEKMINNLRERYKKEKNKAQKERLAKIGISKKKLLENQYQEYREFLYQECQNDAFCIMVIDTLIVLS